MSNGSIHILANLPMPRVEGYTIHALGDYRNEQEQGRDWDPKAERRGLREILARIPAGEQPDLLLCASPEYIPIPTDIAAFRGLKILLITDWNVCLRFLPDLCPLFDLCFTDWPGYRLLRRAGVGNVFHQPMFGHDPNHFRFLGKSRDLDLSFCGNLNAGLHGERNRLLHQVAKWSGGRPVHLRQAFGDEYVDILNRSRLVFNYSIRNEANMRLFETMACGGVALVEESNQEVPILFQEGVHYFRYAPGRIAERLTSLLADPARLEAVARAGRAEAAKHTKSAQMQALLDFSLGRVSGRDKPPAPGGKSLAPEVLGRARKALAKIRILGAGYNLEDSIQELQTVSREFPGLDAEACPALLLTGIEVSADIYQGMVRDILERHQNDDTVPAVIRCFLQAQLRVLLGNHREALHWTDLCLHALADPAGIPQGPDAYRHLYFPVNLGKGFNTDLNHAFRADLAEGKWLAFRDLLLAHCLHYLAWAHMGLGHPEDSLACAERIPKGRFASIDVYEDLTAACLAAKDFPRAKMLVREWFGERPLDTAVWDKVIEALIKMGDADGLAAFVDEMALLAECFLPVDQAERVRGMLARGR